MFSDCVLLSVSFLVLRHEIDPFLDDLVDFARLKWFLIERFQQMADWLNPVRLTLQCSPVGLCPRLLPLQYPNHANSRSYKFVNAHQYHSFAVFMLGNIPISRSLLEYRTLLLCSLLHQKW